MALSRPWRTAADIPFADESTAGASYRSAMHALKLALLTGTAPGAVHGTGGAPVSPWVLEGSGNGVAGGMDGVDRLGGATFTPSAWVWAVSPAARSWWCASNAGLGVFLLVECVSTSTVKEYEWRVQLCTQKPTGGGATPPTPAGTTVYGEPVSQYFDNPVVPGGRLNLVMDSAGYFCAVLVRAGGSSASARGAVLLWPTSGQSPRIPWVFFRGYSANAQGALAVAQATGQIGVPAGSLRGPPATGEGSLTLGVLTYTVVSASPTSGTMMGIVNPRTGRFDLLPSLIACSTAGNSTVLTLADMDVCGDGLLGTGEDVGGGVVERVAFGNLLLPFSVLPTV